MNKSPCKAFYLRQSIFPIHTFAMLVFKFRVWLVDEDLTVYRDILTSSTNTLQELQDCILSSVRFDNKQGAQWQLTNSEWRVIRSLSPSDQQNKLLSDLILDPFQHMLLLYDPDAGWEFKLRLQEVLPAQEGEFPLCTNTFGIAPPQYTPQEFGKMEKQMSLEEKIRYKSSIRF